MSKPAVKHMSDRRSSIAVVADLDTFTNSLSSFEFRPAAQSVQAYRETVSQLPACPVCRERELRRLRRNRSKLDALLTDPVVVGCIFCDFPPSDCGAAP